MARRRKGDPSVAVVYLRVSTDEQIGGVETQRHQVEHYARAHKLTIASEHIDEGVSGAAPVDRRTGLLEALRALREHGAGVLLAVKRDRLGRDPTIMVRLEREVSRLGASIVTVDGLSDGDDAGSELLRHMIDGVSRFERRLIAGRVRAGMARVKAEGKTTGTPPLGYAVAVDGKLELEEEEAAAVRRVHQLRGEGHSIRAIASQMNQEGWGCRGSKWHPTTVYRVLRRGPVHAGQPACPDTLSAG